MTMMKKSPLPLVFAAALALSGCDRTAHTEVAVVNVSSLLSESAAAEAAKAHMAEVQQVLQKGFEDWQSTYQALPAEQKQTLRESARLKLNRQLALEQQNANAVVAQAIKSVVTSWREQHPAYRIVIPDSAALSYDSSLDITQDVFTALKQQTLTFAPLPTVTVVENNVGTEKDTPRENTSITGKSTNKDNTKK